MKQPKILVVGSINMDLFVEGANAIPGYGESIRCRHYGYAPGGKGSNQAFAVAKQGADVVFVGCIGDDENGKQVKASLDKVLLQRESHDLLESQSIFQRLRRIQRFLPI